MFNLYTIRARINPIVLFVLPVLILFGIYAIRLEALQPYLYSTIVIGAVTFLLAQIGRDQGKKKEKKLWAEWGGPPTTQILRWRDKTIPAYLKKRYHDQLHARVPALILPDLAQENQDANAMDEIYAGWAHFLRGQTRDNKKYGLLFQENMNYGFRRNLWGMKPAAITLLVALLVGNYGYHYNLHQDFNPIMYSGKFWYSLVVLTGFLLGWIFIVTKDFVKVPAFAYAERLCECIDHLP